MGELLHGSKWGKAMAPTSPTPLGAERLGGGCLRAWFCPGSRALASPKGGWCLQCQFNDF